MALISDPSPYTGLGSAAMQGQCSSEQPGFHALLALDVDHKKTRGVECRSLADLSDIEPPARRFRHGHPSIAAMDTMPKTLGRTFVKRYSDIRFNAIPDVFSRQETRRRQEMPSDFTVIQSVRQRFGDEVGEEELVEKQAPFVGASKDFPFSCPSVDRTSAAVLQFESRGVQSGYYDELPRNIIRINGIDIPGGITPGPFWRTESRQMGLWKSHSLIVPANVLREQNVLHIEAVPIPSLLLHLDNFIIDNVVVFFKTRASLVGGGIVGPSTRAAAKRKKKKPLSKKKPPSKRKPRVSRGGRRT
jgi:hypothetical protein